MLAHRPGVPRAHLLLDAMRHGATLLDDSHDDLRHETNVCDARHQ